MMKLSLVYSICFIYSIHISFCQIRDNNEKSLNNYCLCEDTFQNEDTSTMQNLGFAIIKTGYKISLVEKKIVKGSCWDFVNYVYKKSGFEENKITIFKSNKRGPFAPVKLLQSGDWIYHINHQFNNIEHSAIFICWKNFAHKIGITLSYTGRNKNEPGKFGEYNLSSIYSIIRPGKLLTN